MWWFVREGTDLLLVAVLRQVLRFGGLRFLDYNFCLQLFNINLCLTESSQLDYVDF
jgi:hypothetical protein